MPESIPTLIPASIAISRLRIPDGVPDKPAETLEEWFVSLNIAKKVKCSFSFWFWSSLYRTIPFKVQPTTVSGTSGVPQEARFPNGGSGKTIWLVTDQNVGALSGDVDQHRGPGGAWHWQAWPPEAVDARDKKSKTQPKANDQFWRASPTGHQ